MPVGLVAGAARVGGGRRIGRAPGGRGRQGGRPGQEGREQQRQKMRRLGPGGRQGHHTCLVRREPSSSKKRSLILYVSPVRSGEPNLEISGPTTGQDKSRGRGAPRPEDRHGCRPRRRDRGRLRWQNQAIRTSPGLLAGGQAGRGLIVQPRAVGLSAGRPGLRIQRPTPGRGPPRCGRTLPRDDPRCVTCRSYEGSP